MTTTSGKPATTPAPHAAPHAPGVGAAAGWLLFAVIQTGLLTFSAPLVYYTIFSTLTFYDDEGFMMLTVRHLLDGHRPYVEVVTAYGPVYYLYKWLLHGPLGLPLSHDVVRLNAAAWWLATAVLTSGVVFALTRGLALAAATHLLVVLGLDWIANEPGHPQEIGVLVLVALVLASLGDDALRRSRSIVGLGLLVGVLTMIKINLGVLAGASVWMALTSTLRADRVGTALRAVSTAAIVALPMLLTWPRLDLWMPFTLTEVAAVTAVAVIARSPSPERRGVGPLAIFVAACIAGMVVGALYALVVGASLSDLIACLVVVPRRLGDLTFNRPTMAAWSPAVAGVAVALSALCAWLPASRLREGWTAAAVALAKLAFAACAVLSFWHPWPHFGSRYLYPGVTPFLWLALLPGVGGAGGPAGSVARLVLVWTAVLQPLQAYPVPASQLRFGTFLHVVCGMVALADVRDWARVVFPGVLRPAVLRAAAAMAIVAVAILSQSRLGEMRKKYDGLTPLALPGAERIRVTPGRGRELHALVEALQSRADTFLTYPGFNSLYFWTGKRPPTLDVLSHEVRLYSEERQEAMIQALLAYPHPYVVRFRGLRQPDPEFVERIDRHFTPTDGVGSYELLVRRD